MSAGGECLTLVVQAWGARFSDHPSLIGSFAPSPSNIRTSPIRDLSEYGQRRDGFALAMADRAFKAIDRRGVLRKPSVQGCTALVMLDFLQHWEDQSRSHGAQLLSSAVEHLRYLNEHVSEDSAEVDVPKSLSGALFWLAYVRPPLPLAYCHASHVLILSIHTDSRRSIVGVRWSVDITGERRRRSLMRTRNDSSHDERATVRFI